jgi:hypothetical protein
MMAGFSLPADSTYVDTLEIETSSGEIVGIAVEGERSSGGPVNPTRFETGFWPAYPNPCSDEVHFRFIVVTTWENPLNVRLRVVNRDGITVAELIDTSYSSGIYGTTWDLTDRDGSKVSPGTYRAFIQIGEWREQGDVRVE